MVKCAHGVYFRRIKRITLIFNNLAILWTRLRLPADGSTFDAIY